MTDERRFYEAPAAGALRSAPAAQRNRDPIAHVLSEWLPPAGLVLEIASGTGEHAVHFAGRFPDLDWQPSDVHPEALGSIAAWRAQAGLPNVRPPIVIDAGSADWPIERAEAVLSINMQSDSCVSSKAAENSGFDAVINLNMVHISPWTAAPGHTSPASRASSRKRAAG